VLDRLFYPTSSFLLTVFYVFFCNDCHLKATAGVRQLTLQPQERFCACPFHSDTTTFLVALIALASDSSGFNESTFMRTAYFLFLPVAVCVLIYSL